MSENSFENVSPGDSFLYDDNDGSEMVLTVQSKTDKMLCYSYQEKGSDLVTREHHASPMMWNNWAAHMTRIEDPAMVEQKQESAAALKRWLNE